MRRSAVLLLAMMLATGAVCAQEKTAGLKSPGKQVDSKPAAKEVGGKSADAGDPKKLPDSYWKKKLDPNVYNVTRCSATEAPFTGKYWNNHKTGMYMCSNCGKELFDSKDKFDSGTGWPSFTRPVVEQNVATKRDVTLGMVRDEVVCKHCGAHLGHVFNDGPVPTGKRFCINSASLDFNSADSKSKQK